MIKIILSDRDARRLVEALFYGASCLSKRPGEYQVMEADLRKLQIELVDAVILHAECGRCPTRSSVCHLSCERESDVVIERERTKTDIVIDVATKESLPYNNIG